jgi:uncharacterized protein YjbI with pentapeptide repeats
MNRLFLNHAITSNMASKRNSTPRQVWLFVIFLTLAALACDSSVPQSRIESNNLEGEDFSHEKLWGRDLSYKNLRNVDFTWTDLRNSNLQGADLTGANLNNTQFTGANLTGATLDPKWTLIIDILTSGEGAGRDLRGYDLSYAYLFEVNLSDAQLQDANLMGAYLVLANLEKADLSDVNLKGADLRGANLNDANLTNANLKGVDFLEAVLTGAIVTQVQLDQAARLDCAVLPGGTQLSGEYC